MSGQVEQRHVAAAIVDADDLVILGYGLENRFDPVKEKVGTLLLIVHRHHHRQERWRHIITTPSVLDHCFPFQTLPGFHNLNW